MKIIIDTNIIVADYRMTSPSFQVLLENCLNEVVQLNIPQIVIDETINKFAERLETAKITTEKEINTLNKITGGDYGSLLNETSLNTEVEKYKAYLYSIITTHKINVLPYPETKHSDIAKRAMNRRKPFNSSGVGYRDTLIWENVKQLLTQDQEILILPEVVFITNNHTDFATPKSELHPDLICELDEELYNPESVRIFLTLNEYVDKIGKISLEQVERLEKKLKTKEFDDLDLNSITANFLIKNFIGTELNNNDIDLPDWYDNPNVQFINEGYEIEEISVKKLSALKILIDVSFDCDIYLDFYLSKMEYYSMDEEDRPSIIDSDWNDYVMWAQTIKTINISMSILINTEMEVLGCEITKINKSYA